MSFMAMPMLGAFPPILAQLCSIIVGTWLKCAGKKERRQVNKKFFELKKLWNIEMV